MIDDFSSFFIHSAQHCVHVLVFWGEGIILFYLSKLVPSDISSAVVLFKSKQKFAGELQQPVKLRKSHLCFLTFSCCYF